MRGTIQILSVLSLLLGAPLALLGAVAMLYARWAPAQPTPSLNEGPGLAGFLGFFMTIFGSRRLTDWIVSKRVGHQRLLDSFDGLPNKVLQLTKADTLAGPPIALLRAFSCPILNLQILESIEISDVRCHQD